MKLALRSLLFALCATGAVTLASAQLPPNAIIPETAVEVKEASSANVTLPQSVPGSLLMRPHGDNSPLTSYPVTAATKFTLHGKEVPLADFRAALLGRDVLLAVSVRIKTGEIVKVRGP
jgi:hypothetical protein